MSQGLHTPKAEPWTHALVEDQRRNVESDRAMARQTVTCNNLESRLCKGTKTLIGLGGWDGERSTCLESVMRRHSGP